MNIILLKINYFQFTVYKCAYPTILRVSLQRTASISFDSGVTITDIDKGEAYKYLGVNAGESIHHKNERNRAKRVL